MKHSLTRITALAALAAFLSGAAATTASAESNLTIPESVFDFGFAPQKSKLTHKFWLKSTGDDILIIDKVVPG